MVVVEKVSGKWWWSGRDACNGKRWCGEKCGILVIGGSVRLYGGLRRLWLMGMVM